jgi:hypothetical protein
MGGRALMNTNKQRQSGHAVRNPAADLAKSIQLDTKNCAESPFDRRTRMPESRQHLIDYMQMTFGNCSMQRLIGQSANRLVVPVAKNFGLNLFPGAWIQEPHNPKYAMQHGASAGNPYAVQRKVKDLPFFNLEHNFRKYCKNLDLKDCQSEYVDLMEQLMQIDLYIRTYNDYSISDTTTGSLKLHESILERINKYVLSIDHGFTEGNLLKFVKSQINLLSPYVEDELKAVGQQIKGMPISSSAIMSELKPPSTASKGAYKLSFEPMSALDEEDKVERPSSSHYQSPSSSHYQSEVDNVRDIEINEYETFTIPAEMGPELDLKIFEIIHIDKKFIRYILRKKS